jgi:hypothetical protein
MIRADSKKHCNIKDIDGYGLAGQEILAPDLKRLLCQFGIHAIHKDGNPAIP